MRWLRCAVPLAVAVAATDSPDLYHLAIRCDDEPKRLAAVQAFCHGGDLSDESCVSLEDHSVTMCSKKGHWANTLTIPVHLAPNVQFVFWLDGDSKVNVQRCHRLL
jgi:hypothetical protein